MRNVLALSVIIHFLSGIFFISYTQNGNELHAKIDEYMTRAAQNGFSGSILVEKNGAIILSKCYGHADRVRKIPVTNETVFTIGSITKQFTAAAILKLQMMGKLSVHDPINKYFKDVPEDKSAITLHHLLTHTTGFPDAIGDDFAPVLRDEFIRLALNTKLNRQPGESYEYSNVGYSLLGAIVEIVTGQSYEQFLHDYLFEPAGMMNTGYRIPKWQPDELAHGYRGDKDWGTLLDKPWAEDGPYWHLRANGGILSTVEDLYQWHVALQGNNILSEEAKKALYTPYVREGEDTDSFYGYGWAIFTTPRNTRLIAHNGGNGIFSADFLRYLDEDVVIIAFSNTSRKPAWKVSAQIARIVFGYDYTLPTDESQPMSQEELKNSPLGQHITALIDILNRSDEAAIRQFIASHFAPRFLNNLPLEEHLRFFKRMAENLQTAVLVQALKTGPFASEFRVCSKTTGKKLLFTMELEPKEPYRIAGLGVEVEEE